jgi:uncharacterized protein
VNVQWAVPSKLPQALTPVRPVRIDPSGWFGARVEGNVQRLLDVDVNVLLAGFRHRPGEHPWIGEHIGKWIHAATLASHDNGSNELRNRVDEAVAGLIATQEPDGYLGTYAPDFRFGSFPGSDWDVWTHTYCLIGLLTYHQHGGDTAALAAARRAADLLVDTFGDDRADILPAGWHTGMAATAVLEPLCVLYRLTGDPRYLEFCRYILRAWDSPHGPRVRSELLESGRVSRVGNGKAYEMLVNIVGLLELARATGDRDDLRAAVVAWNDIVAHHRYITGTASFGEHFHEPDELPDSTSVNMGETCVTVTWLQLSTMLLEQTGEAKYADEIERTLFNHLPAAQRRDGGAWSYYTPLTGYREFDSGISCCISSGPRGIAAATSSIFAIGEPGELVVAQYLAAGASLATEGGPVAIRLETRVQVQGTARLVLDAPHPVRLSLTFRHPPWATKFTVDGEPATADDGWIRLPQRQFVGHHVVDLRFGIELRLVAGDGWNRLRVCVAHGPQVLAHPYDTASTYALDHLDALVPGSPGELRIRIANPLERDTRTVIAIPFADAGTMRRYRVWLDAAARELPLSAFHRAHERVSSGDLERASFNDYDELSFVATEPHLDRPVWFALELDDPVEVRTVAFVHGRCLVHGGWFDTSSGPPLVQLLATPAGAWRTVGKLSGYPSTTAADDGGLRAAQRFEVDLGTTVRGCGLRVIGAGASGQYPQRRFATCALLQAFP